MDKEDNVRLLGCQRKIRSFRANFEKMLAIVQYNKIQIMTAGNFRIIDILEGHTNAIRCMDVSQTTKAVASYSPGLFIVYAPFKGEDCDNIVTLGTLKWKEYWRYGVKEMVRNLSISPIGDFVSMSGEGFMTVWVRDTPSDFSYSQFVYFSKEEVKGVMATVIQQNPTFGFFIQQEITMDGRFIVCLEESSSVLRIFYQDKLLKKEENKFNQQASSSNYGSYGRSGAAQYYGGSQALQQKYGVVKAKVDVEIKNPYANMDAEGNLIDPNGTRQGNLTFQNDDFCEYHLPKHKNPIVYFKLLHHDLYETEKRYLPNVILTVTSINEVFLWQENLLNAKLQFTCVHVFRGYSQHLFFDAAFLEFPPNNPKRHVEVKTNVSKIFDTMSDKILALKKDEENTFGIYKENYKETSVDWIFVLNDQIMDIFKAEGLRNFPQRTINVFVWNRVKMHMNPRDFFGSAKIITASCRDFTDVVSLYTLNTNGQLIKLRKDFREQGSGKWKIDKVAILKREYIEDVMVHNHLPVLAHLMNNTEIYFYIEEKTKNRIVQESLTGGSMRFLGAYSVFQSHAKTAQYLQSRQLKNQKHLQIIRAKWVNAPLCQMIVQFTNDTLALLCSQTQLRILSHSSFKDEYMKLWDGSEKGRSLIAEKWEKLYEIHFNQGRLQELHQGEEEHIVDFEVIKTDLIDEGKKGFSITLVVFTSFNQYLVYETDTSLQANLKTLSQTKLLYHVFTTDCVHSLLSSISIKDSTQKNHSQKTVMALVSEVKPGRQRKELAKKREEEKAAAVIASQAKNSFGFDEGGSNSSSEDDGDIFAQFTGGSSKKKEQFLKKKPTQPVPQPIIEEKKEEPLKSCVMIKLVQFDEESSGKKEHQELWKLEMDLQFKQKIVKSISSDRMFAFLINEMQANNEEHLILYLYDFKATKYMGFINLTENLEIPNLSKIPLDLIFSSGALKGCLTLFTKDTLYLIAENSRNGQPGKWSLIRKIDNVIGLDQKFDYTQITIHESFLKKQVLIVNKNIVSVQDKFLMKELLKPNEESKAGSIIIKYPLHQIYTQSQKSFSIFDPKVLKNLYVKGYSSIVVKILVQLLRILEQSTNSMASDFLDLDLSDLMDEVQQHINAINSAQVPGGAGGKKKQETASSIFDDFYGSVLDENPYNALGNGKKEESKESKKAANDKMLEQEFEEGFGKLLILVRQHGQKILGLRNFTQRAQLLEFLKRFKAIYKKEFFADNLTCILLRDFFFQTEDVEEEKDEEAPALSAANFNAAQFMSQMKSQLKANVSSVKSWNSLQCCLALHSEMQDVLLNELQDRLDFESNLNWDLMKKLCLPVWVKDTAKLKALINTVAKNEYKMAGDEFQKTSRAEKTALWYILIDKKDSLTRLYKQEPQFVKVYELLLNDFSIPKYKTIADKNAMVLMSKQNYMLSCTFFILSGSLKDAINVSLNRVQDPILAILIARMTEKDAQPAAFGGFDDFSGQTSKKEEKKQEKFLENLYFDQFIQRGIKIEDPYLQNIGYWQRKEYLQAVNVFHIDPSKLNNMEYFFKQSISEFNLYFNTGELQTKQQSLDAMALIKKLAEQQKQEIQILPEPSSYNYYALDFIKALRKSTMVKRSLQQTSWKQDSYSGGGGDGSIFDDFFGGSGQDNKKQAAKQEEKKEENKLIIEESKILEYVAGKTATNGYTLQALIVMAENSENVEKAGSHCRETLSETIIADFMNSPTFNYNSLKKLKNSAAYLVRKFNLNQYQLKFFILRQFGLLDNFLMQVNYLTDMEDKTEEDNSQEVIDCVEEWALRITDFVQSLTDFPYALISDSKDIASVKYIIKKAISYLEDLTQSFIIMEMYTKQHLAGNKKSSEEEKRIGGPRIDTTQARKINLTLADPDADEGNYEFSVEEEKGNVNLLNMELTRRLSSKGITLTDKLEEALQIIGSMTRIGVVIYLGLIQVSIASRRFGILKELLEDTRKLFQTADQYQSKESTQAAVVMQKVKTLIQQLQYSFNAEEVVVEQDDYENPKTAEEKAEEASKRKINLFWESWIQYIVTHHLVQVIRSAYEKTQIRSLIDQRPSIVENKPMKQVVEMILNPRISSSDLLKRFTNQDRMQENVTTYCFENFLTYMQRYTITHELGQLNSNRFEDQNGIALQIDRYFGKDSKFSEFASYLDIGHYIKNLRDHEISLVGHTNQDYSQRLVERTQQLYQSGVDIFRIKNEVVNGFAFDHCDLDLVALALQAKGVREIPVKKSLLYRTRVDKGHQVADEEGNSWYESLNRFNKVAQAHPEMKPQGEAIIAAIEKLYTYKTINFTKKPRRSRGTFFLDYEMNPPDMWSGQKQSDFTKIRSDQDITHDDFANAVESHPYLPLYVTGNQKGHLCLWEFNQMEDKSLDYWITEPGDAKSLDQKKTTIKKISFNSYGDKIFCNNQEGNIYVFSFDSKESSKTVPIYSLKRGKDDKLNDFDLISADTVYALTAQKPKRLWLYDTLLSSRGGLVLEAQQGGNILQPVRSKTQLLLFNGDKPGMMTVFDLKMNRVLNNIALHNDEITSVDLNESENTLVAGFKDGIIKIYNIDKNYEQRESFQAFSVAGNKKGGVSQIRIHPTNGALYAASTIGNFKLFRPKV